MKQAELSESDALARLKNRDPEVLADLVNEHSRPLYRAARGMGFKEDEAEDMVQDVFITFLASIDRFEGRSQLRTWLFGILHHKSMERRRKRVREDQHDTIDEIFESKFDGSGSWASPPQDLVRLMESKQIGEAIAHCMEGLPPLQRSVFVLREMEGLDGDAVCKILEVSVTNMGVLMFRARNRLRECLEGRGWGKTQ
ncbi:MAG: sigma-70 family RNA polymerase sigma factor [Acidobacteria bacterium]|nr:sigma-70 family RNA polymerase sigma factor [Acidobacteriota bacterium]